MTEIMPKVCKKSLQPVLQKNVVALLKRDGCTVMHTMKGTKVQTLGARAVAGAWCMAGWLLGPGP